MKIFTKIMLIASGIMAAIGVVCIVIACSMGLNWGNFKTLLSEGKFSINIENGFFGIHLGDDDEISNETYYVSDEIVDLTVQYGAGELEIMYGDVEQIQIETKDVINFSVEVDGKNLLIAADLGANNRGDSSLKIVLPKDIQLANATLVLGASAAKVADLRVVCMNIEVGAGQATLKNIDLKYLEAEVGVGALLMELVGKQSEYSYNVDCGIGAVTIGSNTYGGLGAETSVKVDNAVGQIDVDCGIGEVKITFTE
ncbi:MAG: hypothetical protein E7283_02985 [Lachnospiraceae bacterium]|nr:hypothetical protein [Lachnospiraceae bacterium]